MLMPLPEAIIAVWVPFAALLTQPVWRSLSRKMSLFQSVF